MYPTTFPGITLSGIYIHEPGGLITDLLIAVVSLWLVIRLKKPNDLFDKYWTLFIAMIGLGAAGGVLVHGIPTVLGPKLFYIIWVAKNVFIPIGNLFASYIILSTLFPQKIKLIDLYENAKLKKIILINNGNNGMLKTCCTNYWWHLTYENSITLT